MVLRKIGEAVTGTNGKCVIPYTGVGVGRLQMRGQYEEDGRVIQSEPYSLWDTLWYDIGTDDTKDSTWKNPSSYLTVSHSNDGRTVTKTEDNTKWRYYFYNATTISSTTVGGAKSITTPSVIEFEVTAITGTILVDILDNLNNHWDSNNITATGSYKIVCDGSEISFYKDGTEIPITPSSKKVLTGSNYRFGFSFNAKDESITFKNFKIYSY